jgi:hypothetical protein
MQQDAIYGDDGPRFTRDILNHVYDDNANIKAARLPSALVEVPRINEKYETQSYSQIQGRDLQALKIATNAREDPIGNLNSAFFGVTDPVAKKPPVAPYEEIFKKQQDFNA